MDDDDDVGGRGGDGGRFQVGPLNTSKEWEGKQVWEPNFKLRLVTQLDSHASGLSVAHRYYQFAEFLNFDEVKWIGLQTFFGTGLRVDPFDSFSMELLLEYL